MSDQAGRLAELEHANARLGRQEGTIKQLRGELERVSRENEQLREALRRIADIDVDVDATGVCEIADIVIAALAAAGDGEAT